MTGKPLSPEIDASLAALEAKRVSAATDCRRVAMDRRDAARILVTVNRRGDNKDFDKMLREVHQLGFRRQGDAELLLLVHGSDGKSLASRAKRAYLGTLRGALSHDFFNNPEHSYAKIVAVALAALTLASVFCRLMPLNPYASAIRLPAWIGIKVSVAALMLASLWSVYVLAQAASKLGNRTAAKAVAYAKLPVAAACVAAGIAMSWRAPYMFVVGCAAAAVVLRRG